MKSAQAADRGISVVLAILAILATMFLSPGVAGAASADTGYRVVGFGITPDACYYSRAQSVVPASNGSNVDIKAFMRKKDLNNGCSLSWANKSFDTQEGSVRAILYRTSDYNICTSTSETTVPSGYPLGFGVGKTYNKSGICASTTYFTVEAQGYYFVGGNRYTNTYQPSFTI